MKFTVTQDHIDRGQPKIAKSCPITLAVQEQNPWKTPNVSTRHNFLQIGIDCYELPNEAKDFIRRFDGGYTVKPFSFHLTPITNSTYIVRIKGANS